MTLKVIGTADCPACDQPAQVGVSQEGEGRAVHLLCAPCGVNLQARRSSAYGLRLIEQASEPEAVAARPPDGDPYLAGLDY